MSAVLHTLVMVSIDLLCTTFTTYRCECMDVSRMQTLQAYFGICPENLINMRVQHLMRATGVLFR